MLLIRLACLAADSNLALQMGLRSASHLHLLQSNAGTARSLMLRHNLRLIILVANRYLDGKVEPTVLAEVCSLSYVL